MIKDVLNSIEKNFNAIMNRFSYVEGRLDILEKHCLSSDTLESVENCTTCKYKTWRWSSDGLVQCFSWSRNVPEGIKCQHYKPNI